MPFMVTNTMPPAQPFKTATPAPMPAKTPNVVGQNPPVPPSTASNLNYKGLSFTQIKSKIAEAKREMQTRPPQRGEWGPGLTAMRERMNADTSARIIAGGRVEGFLGDLPGVAEEAVIALRTGRPLYILGGFGGCAADIAQASGFAELPGIAPRDWGQNELFSATTSEALANGLDFNENCTLAATPHVDEAIALVLRGLLRLANR